ncbi:MAG: ATP-binding protein [Verrucomicrobiota bacterium]
MMTTQESIDSLLLSAMEKAGEAEDHYRSELKQHPTGRCPQCGVPGVPTDPEATVTQSQRFRRLVIVGELCDECKAEDSARDRLKRYGVERRNLHATFDGWQRSGSSDHWERQDAAAQRARDWCHDPESLLLYLGGRSGTGKGYLAAACVREHGQSARWVDHAQLIDELHAADFADKNDYLVTLKRCPLLVINEFGRKKSTDTTREVLFGIFSYRYDQQLKTIVTSNFPFRAQHTAQGKKSADFFEWFPERETYDRFANVTDVIRLTWGSYRNQAQR